MRIVAVTRVFNEEDIIEAMARHHAALMDHHVFLDNGSTDRTLEILRALAAEGISLTLLQNTASFYAEESYNTGLYNFAVQHCAAEWVCFLDADEFVDLRHVNDFRSYLETVSEAAPSLGLQLFDYEAASPTTAHSRNVVQRMVRRRPEGGGWWKVFIRGGFAPARIGVAAGNHHIFLDGTAQAPLEQHDIRLAHFSNRSPYQWAQKALIGRLKVLAAGQDEKTRLASAHYVGLFEQFKRDPAPWLAANLDHAARMQTDDGLTDDPIAYLGHDLLYTETIDHAGRAVSLTVRMMEQMARTLGALRDSSADLRARMDADVASVKMLVALQGLPACGYGAVVSSAWRLPADAGFAALLGSGWSKPEDWGVWGIGTLHVLRMSCPPAPGEDAIEIELDVSAYLPRSRPAQQVAVFAGVVHVADWIFTHDANRAVRSIRVSAQHSISLAFRPSYAIAPSAVDAASSDNRLLGMGLWGLRKKALLF